jgi:hypothetical protein
MMSRGFGRHALGIGFAVVLLAGCGGSQTGTTGAVPVVFTPLVRSAQGGWTKPGTSGQDLIYVAGGDGNVYAVTYQGVLVNEFNAPNVYTEGLCSDAHGNVFITSQNTNYVGYIYEFAHGGTQPIATLDDSKYYYPLDCASDPTTGNLAIVDESIGYEKGGVAIYQNAQGSPTRYTDPNITVYENRGYDDKGNLFIVGQSSSNNALDELPAGSSTFMHITLNKNITLFGSVQWDGKHVTVQNRENGTIYRIAVSGSVGTVVGATIIKGLARNLVGESWIQGKTLVEPAGRANGYIGVWHYPRGGQPISTFKNLGAKDLFGSTVSVGSNH